MDKFGKIRRHNWKERYKINNIAKFESDLLKTYEDIAPQTFVWWGVGGGAFVGGGGGGGPTCGPPRPPPPPYKRL